MLILHLGDQLGGLEEVFTRPGGGATSAIGSGIGADDRVVDHQMVFDEAVHIAVVLLVEHVVDRGEANIFIHPAIAGHMVNTNTGKGLDWRK